MATTLEKVVRVSSPPPSLTSSTALDHEPLVKQIDGADEVIVQGVSGHVPTPNLASQVMMLWSSVIGLHGLRHLPEHGQIIPAREAVQIFQCPLDIVYISRTSKVMHGLTS